jgi:hypothetical protein
MAASKRIPLTDIQKRQVYMSLASRSMWKTGLEFGFEKYYPTAKAINQAVKMVKLEVESDPEKYAITPDLIETVRSAMASRMKDPKAGNSLANIGVKSVLGRVAGEEYKELDDKDLVLNANKKSWILINRKLDRILKSGKKIDDLSLGYLTSLVDKVFDKARIVKGEATENIAIRSKIDININPQQALEEVIKRRYGSS